MREIKFRAWDKEGRQMLYARQNQLMITFLGELVVLGHFDGNMIKRKPETFEIIQYTGLKDRNGKEIYEGDIVFIKSFRPEIYEVVYDRGGFCLKEGDDSNYYPDIKYAEDERSEVIGNRFENPDLLTKRD